MSKKLRVASWNIAGGCRLGSDKAFDYKSEDINYFIAKLAQLDADVICLQESHTSQDRSLARIIAEALGDYSTFDSPLSASHINSEYKLAISMLGKEPFDSAKLYEYPDPSFELRFPDGRIAQKHRKGMQVVSYQGVTIANTHWLSMLTFGYSYASGEGADYGSELIKVMIEHLLPPSIVCGDFNAGEFEFDHAIVPLVEHLHLKSALPDESTFHLPGRIKPEHTNAPDRIYVSSPGFNVIESGVIATDTDHYLCWADIVSPS